MSQYHSFRITDFSGGYNSDRHPLLLEDNEATQVLNFRLDRLGSLVSRDGWSPYNDVTPSDNYLALGRWTNKDSPTVNHVIAQTGTKLVRVQTTGNSDVWTGLTGGTAGSFSQFEDQLIFVSSGENPVTYDGVSARELGIAAPTADLTSSTGSGSLVSGTKYYYYYTYANSTKGLESNGSPALELTGSTGYSLTPTASTQEGVDTIYLYRSDGGGVALRIGSNSNTATAITDNGIDPSAIIIPTNHDAPMSGAEFSATLRGYLFLAKDQTLAWSLALQPDYFPTSNSTEVPFEGGDRITGLVSLQDSLLVFGTRNILIVTNTQSGFSISRIDADVGCVSPHSIVEVDGSVVFLSHKGIYKFPQLAPIETKSQRELMDLLDNQASDAAACFVPQHRSYWLSLGSVTYVVHLPTASISRYSISAYRWLGGGDNGFSLPLWIDNAPGQRKVIKQMGGEDDNGNAIPLLWRSKTFQLDNPELTKFFRRIGAFLSAGAGVNVTITIADGGNSYSVPLRSIGETVESIWDTATWDSSYWTFNGIAFFLASLPGGSTLMGRTFTVEINGIVTDAAEIIPPVTFSYREANRFLGL